MTKIKLCGLTRLTDIEVSNRLRPEYVGFVFAQKSRRYITPEKAAELKKALDPAIQAVGVFVDEDPDVIAQLLDKGVIDLAQLHGNETEKDIMKLKGRGMPVIRAFQLKKAASAKSVASDSTCGAQGGQEECQDYFYTGAVLTVARNSCADHVLLDSGAGCGKAFDWSMLENFGRPYFLAGGLDPENVTEAVRMLHPYAVDVSSGIETDGMKDHAKMEAFVRAVRNCR
ncbi:MAG: phosphoribosylanthranilate isomerase [Blautia sp.]|nr:phosphoribosylanthranilate isomerase [Blautia sp.]